MSSKTTRPKFISFGGGEWLAFCSRTLFGEAHLSECCGHGKDNGERLASECQPARLQDRANSDITQRVPKQPTSFSPKRGLSPLLATVTSCGCIEQHGLKISACLVRAWCLCSSVPCRSKDWIYRPNLWLRDANDRPIAQVTQPLPSWAAPPSARRARGTPRQTGPSRWLCCANLTICLSHVDPPRSPSRFES